MKLPILVLAACLLAGCATSHWESEYVGVHGQSSAAAREPLDVREVPWNRINATLRVLEADVALSDIPPSEWPPERTAEAHAKLLRGLQVQADPRRVEVLGRSEFATTDNVRPNTEKGRAQLEAFAATVGADTVVWSSHSLGLADRIVDRPVFTNRRGDSYGGDPAQRATYSETETMWIPVRVQSERTAFIAFFLRYTPDR